MIVQETFLDAQRNVSVWDCGPHYIKGNPEKVKPYLRPMSSMTEEEEKEYRKTMDKYTHKLYPDSADFSEHTEYSWTTETFDFLNAHHFDYRGLIPKGLAIEAPEDMYNFNKED
ncbi:MAG: hypothetical protein IJS48_03765 [Prevotella sp.]|nr:hypothetical protein [Prevotella sp.]